MKVYGIISFGATIAALGVSLFLMPVQLVAGGLSGIGIILHRLWAFPVGFFMLLANIPLFILGCRTLSKTFLFRSVYGSVLFSVLTDSLSGIAPITNNALLCSLFGGGLLGLGIGIMFWKGATTGGTDIVAHLLHKHISFIDVGKWMLIVDASVILFSAVLFGDMEAGLYGVLAAVISGFLIDYALQGADQAKQVIIVSAAAEPISRDIMDKLSRGVTGLFSRGMYAGKEGLALLCIVRRQELPGLEAIVHKHDPNAFIIFSTAREVVGEGFKNNLVN